MSQEQTSFPRRETASDAPATSLLRITVYPWGAEFELVERVEPK